ncbi:MULTISPECIES: hypothetical protein [Allobranchiibius]|uniref:Uncharacterized protein n=1 Tax=Allobranchiibius huperziae TaxID=1874116 RepID=A0A853DLD3_9MICO|nr:MULTISPECIES: hypothetical protein [Allobranchiibius]NYJ75531.1 hypothetical protein [Allobranchiibius huperziae]UIJ36286.1 hypothetical protein LVQ62_07950 [Allobranchiibius sp. GilTou73]
MSWVPGRGRPVAMPYDRTPLRGRSVDPQARIAWLLRLSRLATVPGPAGKFLEMLRAQGCHLGPSTLCRYETGAERVPLSVVRAYEAALSLPAGHLVGVICGIDRMFGPAIAPEAHAPMSRVQLGAALGDWETRVPAGAMLGTDWMQVADVITRPTGPVLPPSVLNSWVDQLLSEAMRSVHHASTTRLHTVGSLLADGDASRILLDSVERVSSEQGARGSARVVAVLGTSADPAVLRWLVGLFERSEGEQQWGAAYGLLNSICRGTLPGDLVPDLSRAIIHAASDGMDRGRPAFMLAQRLSATLTQQVVARLGRYPAPTAAGARVQSPAALSSYRLAALRESGLDDPMLDRLLREALSPDFVERQEHSLLMLAASPYRDVLADVAVQQMVDPAEPYAAQAAAHVLTYLARPGQQQQLVELMVTSGERFALLQALAHAGCVPDEVDLAGLADDPVLAPAAVFAAGMSNHPDLQWFRTNPSIAGSEVQYMAEWWGRTGPAITDVTPTPGSGHLGLAG